MKRLLLTLSLPALSLLSLAACSTPAPPSSPASPSASPAVSGSPGTTPATGTTKPAGPTPGPFTVRYGWAVPSSRVNVDHTIAAPPIPELVEIRTGDHPEESPAYARITFAFRGGYPAYSFAYVPRVTQDGSGDPVPLAGNSFLSIAFTPARAHDDNGRTTVVFASDQRIGYRNLTAYAPAGDFEAHVSYGLGITAAPRSDQVLPIRVGEHRRADGTYVVAFDVRAG